MERLSTGFDITFSPDATTHLKKLALTLNPDSVEFAFFGLGNNGFIDTILTADEKYFRSGPGMKLNEHGEITSTVNPDEVNNLYTKLFNMGRAKDFLIRGHYHPQLFTKTKEALNLSKGDVDVIKFTAENSPSRLPPYSAILSGTLEGPMLQIYRNNDVIKLRNPNHAAGLQKVTIKL